MSGFCLRTGGTAILLCLTAAMSGCAPGTARYANGDAERGKTAIQEYGCIGCHAVSGIADLDSNIGPPLAHMARRGYIAGVLANTPDDMVRWLRDPTGVDPRTAMPNLGVTEQDARDMAAYLHTLR